MDQEGPVRDVLDLHAVECPDGLDDPLDVVLVVREHRHVTDLLPVLDADEVDRIEQPAGTGDRLGQQRERSRPVLEVDAQGRAEGRRRMGPVDSFGAAVRARHPPKRGAGMLAGPSAPTPSAPSAFPQGRRREREATTLARPDP